MKFKSIVFLIFITCLFSPAYAVMYETFNPNLGNISWFEVYNSKIEYLVNNIVFLAKRNNLITMDLQTSRIIDVLKLEIPFRIHEYGIINHENGKSEVYFNCGRQSYTQEYIIAAVKIDQSGEFGELQFLPGEFYHSKVPELLADNVNKKVWFFGEKIKIINALTHEVVPIDYPESWQELIAEGVFSDPIMAPGGKYFIVRIFVKQYSHYYYLQVDIENMTVQEIPFEKEILYLIYPWRNHESLSLLKKGESTGDFNLYLFAHKTMGIEHLLDIGEYCDALIFNNDGSIAYVPMEFYGIPYPTAFRSIGVIDLVSMTFEKKKLVGENPDMKVLNELTYDPQRERMFSTAFIEEPLIEQFGELVGYFIEIDLETFEFSQIENFPVDRFTDFNLLEDTSKIISHSQEQGEPFFLIFDIDQMNYKTTIDLTNSYKTYQDQSILNPDKICTLDKYGKVAKLLDLDYFTISSQPLRRFAYIGNSETIDYTCDYTDISLFPDESGFITFLLGEGTVNYNFTTGETVSYQYSQMVDFILKDQYHNRIIGTKGSNLFFFENDITYHSWSPGKGYSFIDGLIDESSGNTWIVAKQTEEDNLFFLNFKDIHGEPEMFTTEKLPTNSFSFMWNPSSVEKTSFFIMAYDGVANLSFSEWSPEEDEVIFTTNIYSYSGEPSNLYPSWIFIPDRNQVFIWDGYGPWVYDISNNIMLKGELVNDPATDNGSGIHVDYNTHNKDVVVVDLHDPNSKQLYEIQLEGSVSKTIDLPDDFYENVLFNLVEEKVHLIQKTVLDIHGELQYFLDPQITTVHLSGWENAPTIKPRTNNVEYHPGTSLRLNATITNSGPTVDVTAYLWFWLADGTFVCFDGIGVYLEPKGISFTLPEGTDISFDFMEFNIPAGLPQGLWTANALFLNNNTGQRGPSNNFNFYFRTPE